MSHVEHHVVLEILLVLLQKFDEETEDKYVGQAEPEEEAAMQFLAVILIQVNHDEEQDKISDLLRRAVPDDGVAYLPVRK